MHQVFVDMQPYKEVAQEYGISLTSVNNLVCKAKKKAKFIEELVS